jgi:hypothetical protein
VFGRKSKIGFAKTTQTRSPETSFLGEAQTEFRGAICKRFWSVWSTINKGRGVAWQPTIQTGQSLAGLTTAFAWQVHDCLSARCSRWHHEPIHDAQTVVALGKSANRTLTFGEMLVTEIITTYLSLRLLVIRGFINSYFRYVGLLANRMDQSWPRLARR